MFKSYLFCQKRVTGLESRSNSQFHEYCRYKYLWELFGEREQLEHCAVEHVGLEEQRADVRHDSGHAHAAAIARRERVWHLRPLHTELHLQISRCT